MDTQREWRAVISMRGADQLRAAPNRIPAKAGIHRRIGVCWQVGPAFRPGMR